MVLDYKYSPEPFSTKSGEELWFVDFFENKRLKEYSEKALDEIDFSKGTDLAFFNCMKEIRPRNICREITYILNLFLSHNIWYDEGVLPRSIDEFEIIESHNENYIPFNDYFKPNFRYTVDLSVGKDRNRLFLPDTMEYFFDRYFSLSKERKTRLFSASHYFYQAERAINLSPGIKYLLFACAIDALTPSNKSAGKRFKGYIKAFSGISDWKEDEIKFIEKLWKIRSDPAHGDIIRHDLILDCDFYAGKEDYCPDYEKMRSIAQCVCINWLSADDKKINDINNSIKNSLKGF